MSSIGYIDFLTYLKNSSIVFTDSGGVQQETVILDIPTIILRDKTERPETIESGSSLVVMNDLHGVINGIKFSVENNNPSDVQGYSD